MSLRARLLVGMVALVATGLAVAAVVTYEEQRSFLLSRVDQQVESAVGPVSFILHVPSARRRKAAGRGPLPGEVFGHRPPGLGPATLPPGTFGAVLGSHGQILRQRTFTYNTTSPPAPRLPAKLPLSRAGGQLKVFTVQASGGSGARYRAAAFAIGSGITVVAVPLRETQDTLHRLIVVEALVGAGVIVALIALGWIVIRIGLRPLERIGRVAAEIAQGDLSRRVTPADQRTEVGRLGHALNNMLGQIEEAFGDRRRSEDRLRRFLADASHELRTPLASIRGYAELFRLGAADEPATLERAMARIESEARRMGVLVEDLLALAALDQAPERRQLIVDVRELAEHAAEDTRILAPDRDVVLDVHEPATVLGDPDQLRRLLSNLSRNAIMHTPPGTPIELAVSRADGLVVLAVRDHGPGLPPGSAEQLFERFWRSEGGRSRGRGGAGLGLAIAQAIARAHGGDIRAANAAEGGAVFTVTLPASPPGPASSQENLSVLTADSYPQHPD
ncbi:MAG TPA: HAMP domain-containing sensor histidine kinase [Solirubrobacteraceae bacterium]|nr:HAMP domain-containing sensor histidine kinase [Solirubrobacteraceae bacterium]